MKGVDLFDLGLTEEYVRAAAMNAGDLHLARVSVQHKDIYKVITGEGECFAEASGKMITRPNIPGITIPLIKGGFFVIELLVI